jgi:hypothetical protein
MEIRNIFRVQLSETNSVAFNQYGINLQKYKYDPLSVIEAKVAMGKGHTKGEKCDDEEKVKDGQVVNVSSQSIFPSPDKGMQEPPVTDLSSQEEECGTQNEQRGEVLYREVKANNREMANQSVEGVVMGESNQKQKEARSQEEVITGVVINESSLEENAGETAEITNKGKEEVHSEKGEGGGQHSQREDGGTRQSERIKKQNLDGVKIADKAEQAVKNKNLEGNNIPLKNSFAVLDNIVLASKFSKMGGGGGKIYNSSF